MNNISYNQTGGFPLSTNILDAAQTAYTIFNALGFLAGNFAIISGCEEIGNTVNNGVVFINGEVIEFRGGTKLDNVIILEDTETRSFENGQNKVVIHKRYACFGYSVENYAWGLFQRVFPTTLIKSFKDNFETRISALENKPSPIPIGMIAIWNKPATTAIPTGWKECTDLKGRVPVGWDENDADFSIMGATPGSKSVTINQANIPDYAIKLWAATNTGTTGVGNDLSRIKPNGKGGDGYYDQYFEINSGGSGQALKILNPSRVIRFIEYTGQ